MFCDILIAEVRMLSDLFHVNIWPTLFFCIGAALFFMTIPIHMRYKHEEPLWAPIVCLIGAIFMISSLAVFVLHMPVLPSALAQPLLR
jgi:fucose 4-O-acetylase-like acetyltransferase